MSYLKIHFDIENIVGVEVAFLKAFSWLNLRKWSWMSYRKFSLVIAKSYLSRVISASHDTGIVQFSTELYLLKHMMIILVYLQVLFVLWV